MSRKRLALLQDRYGLGLSTSSEAAAAPYRDGIDLMLSSWPGAAEAFDAAIGRWQIAQKVFMTEMRE